MLYDESLKEQYDQIGKYVQFHTKERNNAMGESMTIFKPAMFRDIPDRMDPVRQTHDGLTQAGAGLLTGRIRPYELSKADLGGEVSMTNFKQAMLRTAQSEEREIQNTVDYALHQQTPTTFRNASLESTPRYNEGMNEYLVSGQSFGKYITKTPQDAATEADISVVLGNDSDGGNRG